MVDEPADPKKEPENIGIHYLKSRHYRTINADGAQFGITPRGNVQFTLFTDQAPLPEYVLHEITSEGKLGKLVEEVKKEGMIREVAVNVIMDLNTAVSFLDVFQEILAKAQELRKESSKTKGEKVTETEI